MTDEELADLRSRASDIALHAEAEREGFASSNSREVLTAGNRAIADAAWQEGWNACAEWWEIHHHGVVRDERNPYALSIQK